MDIKACSICGKEKELSEYYAKNKKKSNGEEYIYYYPYCKACASNKSRKYQQDNHEAYLIYRSEHNKRYFSKPENKLRHREHCRKSRAKGVYKEWQQNNKDKINEYNTKRKMNKKFNLSKKEKESCKSYFGYSCAYCGISEDEAKKTQGQKLHMEHAINEGANDLSNCVPSCRVCNSTKKENDYHEWYIEGNPVYSENRFFKIIKWLEEDYKAYIKF